MESLEISKKGSAKPDSSYVGGDEEDDIPDMAEFEEADNIIETDPVRWYHIHWFCGLYEFLEVQWFNTY